MKQKIKDRLKQIKNNAFDSNGVFSTLLKLLIGFYYNIRFRFRCNVDSNIVVFVCYGGFKGKIKEIYEHMLYDIKYAGYQFIVALKDKDRDSFLIKDKTTVVMGFNSRKYLRVLSKSKYWFIDNEFGFFITPKREQVVVLVDDDKKTNDKRMNKFIKSYVDYTLEDFKKIKGKDNSSYDTSFLEKDKLMVQYKIYSKDYKESFFEKYFSKKILDHLYKKYNKNYKFLLNCNFDIDEELIKKYKGFLVNMSAREEVMLNYYTDVLITNNKLFIDNTTVENKELINDKTIAKIDEVLDKNNKSSKKNKKVIDELNALTEMCTKIIFTKNDVKPTINAIIIKNKLLPLKDIYVKSTGFIRCRLHPIFLSSNFKKLKKYENKYKGKRCFLIGNGPSLTTHDLDMLKDEITFGCNLIYKIYDKTKWRPTFHFLADGLYSKDIGQELVDNIKCDLFMTHNAYKHLKNYGFSNDMITFKSISSLNNKDYKVVSPMAYHYPGGTVMSMMISTALFMGFDEIYLLGVDCTSSLANNGHFIKGYMNSNIKRLDLKRVARKLNKSVVTEEEVAEYYRNRVMYVYAIINEYAKKKGIKIYNATRGGVLEVFERKKLEEVLENDKEK